MNRISLKSRAPATRTPRLGGRGPLELLKGVFAAEYRSLPDAELPEDHVQHVLDVDPASDPPQ